jgi:hypothetical protein
MMRLESWAAQALERKLKGSAAAITSRANTTTRVRPVALASRGSLGCNSWICWDGAGMGAGLGLLNTKKPWQGQGWIALWRWFTADRCFRKQSSQTQLPG